MSDIDIKHATDALEDGKGCSMQHEMHGLHFSEQQAIFAKIQEEANGRPGNHLTVENSKFPVIDPDGKKEGDVSISAIKHDGQILFEALLAPQGLDVSNFCRNLD
jgi:hypothetical protein